jgi:hypothetical protein
LTDNLKMRGLGYSILRKQKYGNTPMWRSPAEDLTYHSSKKEKGQNEHSAEK